jgi:GNAT superfamily N-acetyltransferase/predicted nucleic acid-binding protein
MLQGEVGVLSDLEEVAAYVDEARRASDTEKAALGFLPERAYKEAAYQGKLLIAVIQDGDDLLYAGHLLYGGMFPQAKVFQIYTVPRFRRRGIGRRLIEAIVQEAERLQFMSVVAKVADDLAANQFWECLSFETVRTKTGGRTTGRQINVRVRELNTPRLFREVLEQPQASPQDLSLISRWFDLAPIYALDLNILHDLAKKRNNVEDVGRIIRASFNNLVRLAVTEEFIKELEGTSIPAPTDPLLELARRLPRLKAPPKQRLTQIISELGEVIFPTRISSGTLRPQDQSDLVHLATAIENNASGFVTGDKAILRGRAILQSKYSLDVVGASEFADMVEPADSSDATSVQAMSGGQVLEGRPAQEKDGPSIGAFLARMNCPHQTAHDVVSNDPGRPHHRVLVTLAGKIVAFGSWEIPSAIRPHASAFVCGDQDHPSVTLAVDFVLDSISRELSSSHPTRINLRLLPGDVTTKRIAIAHGFGPPARELSIGTELQKIALGRAVTAKNWAIVCQQLKKGMGLELPDSIPPYHSLEQTIPIKGATGQTLYVPLERLESFFSPAIFCLPGRSGAIVPIRSVFAADLIGGAKQLSLLASPEAVLLRERVYFSHPRTAGVLKKGIPILFYESERNRGSASVTAAARIVRVELISKDGANPELFRHGVLDKITLKNISLAETAAATTIDNIMILRNPVSLRRLRLLGAVDRANLVTARSLRAEQVVQIIDEGMA